MNLSTGIIFLIGPGGVGKTTVGKILAAKFGHAFVDLDEEFLVRVGGIGEIIRSRGYESYNQENARVFFDVLPTLSRPTVLILSSGFLTYNEKAHTDPLAAYGVSILLLPSRSLEESLRIVVPRQLALGLGLEEGREKEKCTARFHHYQRYGDIRIFSSSSPEHIADEMIERLDALGA